MTPVSPSPRFVTAFAATDFTGGTATELNDELLARLEQGIAAKVMQGRSNIVALIKSQEAFAETLHYSIIGFGNPEMSRDQHWIWPSGGGGRVDIYARTAALPQSVSVAKTATLVEKRADGGIWQFPLVRTDAPGFYDVVKVLLPATTNDDGFLTTFDQRGFDLEADGFVPDIVNAAEAAYTAYQTAVIRFLDTVTPVTSLAIGATADYVAIVRAMPLIGELQDFCGAAGSRNLAGDVLVKAPVPCLLSINCEIQQAAGETAPDLDAIANDLADTVNNMPFPGQLNVSLVADVIHNYLTLRQAVGPIVLHGKIRRPDGTVIYVRDTAVLRIPEAASAGVTGRTTAIILYPEDVGIRVVTKGFEVSK